MPPPTRHLLILSLLLWVSCALGAVVQPSPPQPVERQEFCGNGTCFAELFSSLEGSLQLLPGVNISATGVPINTSSGSFYQLLESYLKTVTLHVAVYNEPILSVVETASAAEDTVTGRAKKKKQQFQFLSVYTVFAIAFALLSALVGKALTISIVSLVVTLIVSRNINRDFNANAQANSNANSPIYDIVRRPQIQVQHTHTAEDVYEVPSSGSSGGVSYVYASSPHRGRNVVPDPYSPFAPNAVHVTSVHDAAADSGGVVHHHVTE